MTVTSNPIIETERLILRRPVEDDFKQEIEFWQSDRAEFVGGKKKPADVWRSLAGNAGHWAFRGYGGFAVLIKSTNEYIGRIGPHFPEGWPDREIGWTITNPDYEGRGYAYEAALASRNFAYETLGWDRAISVIEPTNTRSIKLAERLGARNSGKTFQYSDTITLDIYRHPSKKELS